MIDQVTKCKISPKVFSSLAFWKRCILPIITTLKLVISNLLICYYIWHEDLWLQNLEDSHFLVKKLNCAYLIPSLLRTHNTKRKHFHFKAIFSNFPALRFELNYCVVMHEFGFYRGKLGDKNAQQEKHGQTSSPNQYSVFLTTFPQ